MAQFPSSIFGVTTHNTGDVIQAADVNNVENEVAAIETKVGVDASAVTTTIDYLLKNTASVSPGHKHVTADITDAGSFVLTGIVLPYSGTSAPTGFLLCNGAAVSRTTYAALFAIVGSTYGSGDGATTFNVPDMRGRSVIGTGTGTKVFTFASRASNTVTITGSANASTNDVQTGQLVNYVSSGSPITGLTSGSNYYLIRIAYNQIQFASSLANAQSATAISLSSDGSGTQTFTITYTARANGDTGGEETHAQTLLELVAHTHPSVVNPNGTGGGNLTGNAAAASQTSGSTGTGNAMNIMPLFLSLTYIIKT